MATRKKPKKGVMPPALKKYWADRLGTKIAPKKSVRRYNKEKAGARLWGKSWDNVKRQRAARKRRLSNPTRDTFRLAIKKGGQTLYLQTNGEKFAKVGPFKRYATPQGVLGAAQGIAEKYANSLRGWKMYSVT